LTFDLLDGDRIFVDAQYASRLAGRGANPAGELWEVIRGVQPLQRFLPLIAIYEVVPVGDDVPQRAPRVAERYAAIHATGALRAQLFIGQDREELTKMLETLGHRLFAARLAPVFHEPADFTHALATPD
jgi:hypothetical protein